MPSARASGLPCAKAGCYPSSRTARLGVRYPHFHNEEFDTLTCPTFLQDGAPITLLAMRAKRAPSCCYRAAHGVAWREPSCLSCVAELFKLLFSVEQTAPSFSPGHTGIAATTFRMASPRRCCWLTVLPLRTPEVQRGGVQIPERKASRTRAC